MHNKLCHLNSPKGLLILNYLLEMWGIVCPNVEGPVPRCGGSCANMWRILCQNVEDPVPGKVTYRSSLQSLKMKFQAGNLENKSKRLCFPVCVNQDMLLMHLYIFKLQLGASIRYFFCLIYIQHWHFGNETQR